MADRIVKVSLQAQVSNYIAGMEQARKKTQEIGTEAEKAQKKLEAQSQAMTAIGTGLLAVGALAVVGIGLAVKKFADFDEAISNVKAATQETSANMGLLREAALEAGASTVFSATEAANAIEELGKAGLTTEQILGGGLDGALSLAAAGQLGVAEAASIAAIAVKQFNLEGADVPHVADLLAAGAGKAVGDVKDLSAALGQAGLVANGAGQSIEDTTGVLAAFADAGLLGSDAGTSLKSAILALQAPTDKARGVMEQYNLSFYDGAGNMLSFDKIAGQLESNLGRLDAETRNAALAQIFGNDAIRSANVLYDEGAVGIRKYIEQTNDSGFAAKVAADRLNNLNGDVEKLGGAFDTYLIRSGSGANDTLRALVQGATGLVDAVGSLPGPVLTGGLAVGGLVTAIALAGGAFLVAVPKVAAFKLALIELKVSGGAAARGIALAGGALAVAGIAFAIFAANQAEAAATTAEFKASLDASTGATTKYTRELVAQKLAQSTAFAGAKEAGISQKELTDAVLEGGDALEAVQKKLVGNNNIGTFFSGVGIRAGNATTDINKLRDALDESGDQLEDEAASADKSAESTGDAATAYQDAATKAGELTSNLSTLIDTINEANGVGQDAVSQNIAYQSALADVDAQIAAVKAGTEGFALGITDATAAGRDNLGMLNDLAGSSQSAAKAQFDLDGNTANYRTTLENGRQAVIDRAIALGATADEAQALADKIYAIPTEKEFTMIANVEAAQQKVNRFILDNNGRRIEVIVDGVEGRRSGPGAVVAKASGGILPGAPSSRDNMFIHAASGEFVTRASQTAIPENRRALEYMNRGGVIKGYANGGYVTPVQYVQGGAGGGSAGRMVSTRTIELNVNGVNDPAATSEILFQRLNAGLAG